jgi:hypothetical protein
MSNFGICEHEQIDFLDLLSKMNTPEKLNMIFEIIKGKITLDTKSNKKSDKKHSGFFG